MRIGVILLLCVCNGFAWGQSSSPAALQSNRLIAHLKAAEWPAAEALLDSNLRKRIDATQLEIIWKGLQLAQGELQQVGELSSREINGKSYYYRQLDFLKSSVRLELQLNAREKISALRLQPLSDADLYLPPAYDDPEKYQEFSLRVKYDSIQLPAIITLPKNGKLCKVVVLLHDIGPQDKDHSIGPNKMFRDLAVGLAAEGIASLRYDKRTFRYGPELMADLRVLTPETEVIQDALAAIALLRTVAEVDTQQVHLLGLGVGGMLAGSIAAQSSLPIRSIVAIGSSPRPLPDQLLDQYIQLLSSKLTFEDMQVAVQQLERQSKLAKSPALHSAVPADSLPLQLPAPYWLYWRQFDPLAGYWQTNARLWFVRGEADYQSQATDLAQWEMRLLGREKTKFSTFPDLNHLLMAHTDAPLSEAYKAQNQVDAAVVRALAAWIKK